MDEEKEFEDREEKEEVTPEEGAPKDASRLPWVVLLLLILIGLGGFWLIKKGLGANTNLSASKYQVVFVNNGQTFYGKLHNFKSDYPYLTDVYYLSTKQFQPSAKTLDIKGNSLRTPTLPLQNYKVVKLIEDLRGPEDKIVFNKQSILFVEELRDDSQVLQAIKNVKVKLGE